eukprot:TRINITY_DN29133_c0_g1_i1.p1 TRINITY_DN29133_c0_g1~~TRINITY_DN29133_c0_g1_i1.p1  ORF type:complete len:332 (-),score=53.72 TRINITY_DN29133_c0_g1_i1:72-1067(-)
MTTLTAFAMDGQSFVVDVGSDDDLFVVKSKLAAVTELHSSEIMLLADAIVLDDDEALQAVLQQDEPEVVFVRIETARTKKLMWYDRFVQAMEATIADEMSVDSFAWIRLGASLYSLGEYSSSWAAYKQSALISRGVAVAAVYQSAQSKVWISDNDLLDDPVVGKYMRYLNRAMHTNRFVAFDKSRALDLLKALVESSRAHEIAEKKWNVHLPNHFGILRPWIIKQCRLPVGSVPGDFCSAGGNRLSCSLKGMKVASEAHITIFVSRLEEEEKLTAEAAIAKLEYRFEAKPKPAAERQDTFRKKIGPACYDLDDWDEDWDADWEDWDYDASV